MQPLRTAFRTVGEADVKEQTMKFPALARLVAALMLLGVSSLTFSQTSKAELLWLGQSAFRLTTPGGKVIMIDPWLRTNPGTPVAYQELEKLGKVDLILVTHGHFDHMGDTGLFGDMKFIGEYYQPDVLLIPIGGNFTLGPIDAAYATREWIKPKMAIPMHYGTNPLAKGTAPEYLQAMGNSAVKVLTLKPGEKTEF